MNLPIDSRSDSAVTVEQQQFNIELFIPYLGWIDRVSTTERQRCDSGATAERQQEQQQQSDSGAIAVR